MEYGPLFAIAAVVLAVTVPFLVLWFHYRGKRIVTCPETHQPVSAEINAAIAAGTWIVKQPRFVISACSRWPEKAGCDQACAPQIEALPQDTLVRNIVSRWYAERTCVYCASPVGSIHGSVAAPALLTADGKLREWNDVAPETLPSILANAVAVCAHCDITEDFRRRFPHLVIERPESGLRDRVLPPRRRVFKTEPASVGVY
jgi:hypothetical protein